MGGFFMQPCQAVDLTSKPPSGVVAEQKVDIIQNLSLYRQICGFD
jgi:hypothetical protein